MAADRLVELAVDAAGTAGGRTYTYHVPGRLADLAPGDRVRHNSFGEGIVVSCEIVPGDQQVTVAFPGKGVKKLMAAFADLRFL